ncbi:MAG TPA: TetR/AcrR family transcriptional regulator [Marmoricola sp.]|nr:TetR/AcrR family transcriptional regulator [Marmoricola sp.]
MAARDNQRARTRRDLVDAALGLLSRGGTPTVVEVADAAGVSRRTAYRYFASAEHLMVDALLEAMRSDVEHELAAAEGEDIAARVDRLVDALHRLTVDKEQLLRQMIRFTLDRGPIEPGVPVRPSRRLEYVEQALSPLRATLTPVAYERLVHAMAVVIGIEARIVLHDICGLDDQAIVATERWAAQALLEAALREATDGARPR